MDSGVLDWDCVLTIAKALVGLMGAEEVIEAFDVSLCQHWRIRLFLINRLRNLFDSGVASSRHVGTLVARLVECEAWTPSPKRQALDSSLARLVPMLSVDEQLHLVGAFIQNRRGRRRRIALQIIEDHYQPDDKQLLLACFERFADIRALITLAKVPADITDIVSLLLQNLPNQYHKARVFQNLLSWDFGLAIDLSSEYPAEFAWGAARAGWMQAVPRVLQIVDTTRRDSEEMGLLIWCLGKLGAKRALRKLASECGLSFVVQ